MLRKLMESRTMEKLVAWQSGRGVLDFYTAVFPASHHMLLIVRLDHVGICFRVLASERLCK